jgi:folate-binding protein YgfZ
MTPNHSSQSLTHARQARETGLLAVLSDQLGALDVAGPDAREFLHSQLTNEVHALQPGQGNLSARVTRTGTLVRYFSLHLLPPSNVESGLKGEHFLLILEREGIASLRADLEKFAIAEDVAFEDVSDYFTWIAVQGPAAPQLVQETFGKLSGEAWADLPEYAARAVKVGAHDGFVFARSLTGDAGFVVAMNRAGGIPDELRIHAAHLKLLALEGAELAETLEILRVEAGLVRVGPDAAEGKLVLPETGMEQQVVSYSKGCYLGQEVIARIRTYGSIPHALRGLVLESGKNPEDWTAALDRLPPLGGELALEDGTKVGSVTSRSISPVLEAPVAFAYLDRAHRTPGTVLKLRGAVTARVALLPFYKASDTQSRVAFLHDRAIRLFSEQQDDKAVELLSEALRLDPSFSDGYEALGVILGRTGKFHEAIDIFKRLEEVAPNEPMVHTNLSLYYMKIGDKQAAEDEKAKATVKLFAKFGERRQVEQQAAEAAAQTRADALRRKAMFEEVLAIDADDPIALFGLGNAYSALGEWENAEKTLAKASAAQKDNSAIYVAHGKALEMLHREADALAVYRKGMEIASRKGDLMPLKEMERRVLLLSPGKGATI